jgi:uncharacterized protein (DUF2141 family)
MLKRNVRRVQIALASLLVTTAAGTAAADPPPDASRPRVDLVVHAVGFKHARGHAIARVFLAGESLSGSGHATVRGEIRGSESTITFPGLTAGPYAVIVLHDENDNGVCDHGLLGPTEPIGFSNGFRLGFLSFPTFDKLKIYVAPDRNRIEVVVR